MNDFLERLVESDYFDIMKTKLKDSVNIEELNNKEFYVIKDYVVAFINNNILYLKIYPEEMCINYYKMWTFFNSRRLLKKVFNVIQGDGNTIIIPLQENSKDIFIEWYSFILFPVNDQQYKNYWQTCLLISHLDWNKVVNNSSIFIIPYSLKEHKLIAYTHLGKIYCNNNEFLPVISEGISQVSFNKNISEYPSHIVDKINDSKSMWIENDKLNFTIPSSKNNKNILVFSASLRKALSINYQNNGELWVDKKSQYHSYNPYPTYKNILPSYYDQEDLNSIRYSSLL